MRGGKDLCGKIGQVFSTTRFVDVMQQNGNSKLLLVKITSDIVGGVEGITSSRLFMAIAR